MWYMIKSDPVFYLPGKPVWMGQGAKLCSCQLSWSYKMLSGTAFYLDRDSDSGLKLQIAAMP